MEVRAESDPEEAHYRRMQVLKILGLVFALCLACAMGTLFGGGLVYGVMKLGEPSPSAEAPGRVIVEKEVVKERIVPVPGALIVEVIPGSPAEEAGLQEGDMIVAVDGEMLSSEQGLAELIAGYEPGDRLRLEVERPGEGLLKLRVRLGEHPEKGEVAYLGVRYTSSPSPLGPGSRMLPFEGLEGHDQDRLPFGRPGVTVERGAIIHSVTENSPASAAGLQEGDVIVALDGEPVDGPEVLVAAVGRHKAGDRVTLTVLQPNGEGERQVKVTLGQHPEDAGRAYLGVMIGGTMEMRRFEGGQLPEGFRFRVEPFPFGLPGDQAPFDWDELPFERHGLPFDPEELPFDWHGLPFDPEKLPFDWHELEPDAEPGQSSS